MVLFSSFNFELFRTCVLIFTVNKTKVYLNVHNTQDECESNFGCVEHNWIMNNWIMNINVIGSNRTRTYPQQAPHEIRQICQMHLLEMRSCYYCKEYHLIDMFEAISMTIARFSISQFTTYVQQNDIILRH